MDWHLDILAGGQVVANITQYSPPSRTGPTQQSRGRHPTVNVVSPRVIVSGCSRGIQLTSYSNKAVISLTCGTAINGTTARRSHVRSVRNTPLPSGSASAAGGTAIMDGIWMFVEPSSPPRSRAGSQPSRLWAFLLIVWDVASFQRHWPNTSLRLYPRSRRCTSCWRLLPRRTAHPWGRAG